MLRTLMFAGLISSSSAAWAQTSVPHTFTPGTRASAAQVNENFAFLANAIDQLSARLSENVVTEDDVVGEYAMSGIQHEVNEETIGVEGVTWGGNLTFSQGGSVWGNGAFVWNSVTARHVLELGLDVSAAVPPDYVPALVEERTNAVVPAVIQGAWSIEGNKLTLMINVDGAPTPFVGHFIGNGKLFVLAWSSNQEYTNSLVIGVKRQP